MSFGFIRTASCSFPVKVGDTAHNTNEIIKAINEASQRHTDILVFQELAVTGYTCGDLFGQRLLSDNALASLEKIIGATKGKSLFISVGLPVLHNAKLYNCVALIYEGELLALIPKTYLPNYNEFYEMRHFSPAPSEPEFIDICGFTDVPFYKNTLIRSTRIPELVIGAEICEDLWSVIPPSSHHALAGATVILNSSAGNEITGKADYRLSLVRSASARLICTYIYSCAGSGESTTDVVFSSHNIICENGTLLKQSPRFENGMIFADTDVKRIVSDRQKNTSFRPDTSGYVFLDIDLAEKDRTDEPLERYVDPHPFVPDDDRRRTERCEEIINIQAHGLKKRLEHTNCKKTVLGISGGLDSTQALIVCAKAFDMLGYDKSGIICVTMPCFGTTDRTYTNAVKLTKAIGATLKEVNIRQAVKLHFEDIGHDITKHDLTFENAQARERTQVLMDIASEQGCFVVGTGDLSELALGWATYNGDHMSMYGVNCSIPKTLIRYLIRHFADSAQNTELKEVLYDILDTPVSPELLPPDENGKIAQITEDVVGPYELHDFFLYNFMRLSYEPKKILLLANIAFKDKYDGETIKKWLTTFLRRFFSQQFKRSCIPDGPKVGSVSLSPRGDWRMPSDACVNQWLEEIK